MKSKDAKRCSPLFVGFNYELSTQSNFFSLYGCSYALHAFFFFKCNLKFTRTKNKYSLKVMCQLCKTEKIEILSIKKSEYLFKQKKQTTEWLFVLL